MSRATRFKLYRALLIVAVVLIVPVIFVVGITLPYLFNTIKITFPDIVIDKDVESYIAEKELLFENTDPRAKKKIIWNDDAKIKTEYSIVYLHGSFATGRQQEEVLIKILLEKFMRKQLSLLPVPLACLKEHQYAMKQKMLLFPLHLDQEA